MVEKKKRYYLFVAVVLLFAAVFDTLSASQRSAPHPDEKEIEIVIANASSRAGSFGYSGAHRCCSRGKHC